MNSEPYLRHGDFGPNRQFSALREVTEQRVSTITRNHKLTSLCGARSASASFIRARDVG